jgi:hypothetical protein
MFLQHFDGITQEDVCGDTAAIKRWLEGIPPKSQEKFQARHDRKTRQGAFQTSMMVVVVVMQRSIVIGCKRDFYTLSLMDFLLLALLPVYTGIISEKYWAHYPGNACFLVFQEIFPVLYLDIKLILFLALKLSAKFPKLK